MPDPKYGYDILIILMDEDTLHRASELPSWDDNECECGALELAPSSPDMHLLKAAILAALESYLPEACPTGKIVISVIEPMRYILN